MVNRRGNHGNSDRVHFLVSEITADGDCSHEIKRYLLLGRKIMINLDSVFKSRDITLPTKFDIVKAMVIPVIMYGCESWTIKKAKQQRTDAFELLEKLLEEFNPEYSLEGLMLKLKLQYFGHLMQRADSWKRP